MGAPPQLRAPSVHNQKRRRYDDDGDAPVLGFKEGSCSMGPSTQPCSPILMDKQKRKRNDDDEDDSKDFLFAKRPRYQPPISRSSESSTAPLSKDGPLPLPSPATTSPSKDGPLPAPATAPPSNDGPSPEPIFRSLESSTAPPSKDGPAPAPRIVPVNREEEEEDDDLLVTLIEHYEGDLSELELYFVIVNNEYGEQTEEELLPGGKDMRVTNDNVITFIHLIANHRLNYQIRHQSLHFLRGFQQLIPKEWIEMFNEHEIQLLISGSLECMDVDDLRSNAQYSGGYHHDHQVIETFWEVIKSFSLEYQKKFLKFVTGCSRGPLLGFKYLEPKFCIQRAAPLNPSEDDLDRLPTSATCMNLLKLPPYKSKEQMQTKLMYAISADAGFDLS